MTEVEARVHPALRGLDEGVDAEALIALRPKTYAAFDAVDDAYLRPEVGDGLSLAARAFVAWTAASLVPHKRLAEECKQELDAVYSGEEPALWGVMAKHVALMVKSPATAQKADVDALLAAGLTLKQLVELAQIVAYVTYQARVLHGMRMWQKEAR
ncbi:hypothetical protein ACFQBQ_12120 [Granulicella cerasi]|uniref:Uncharacterized protein n=1 Tax=Granulicella cerasi TaxID=741063 RepID=A0ABW1ZA57_9BACT|nr:hypothetical protein [Granulicella cerasi]